MKNRSKKPIYIEEYVSINGIEQFLLHSGTNTENPVMLFLHGGPGSAESTFAYTFQEKWEDIFTVVHWDQRGAGKTYTRNPNSYPTIELMMQDLFDLIQYLKQKYRKQKIVILGHSWGSVLGSTFVKKYPDEAACYIGVGQVISMLENERVGCEKLKELAIKAGDVKTLKKLEAIGDYPGEKLAMDSDFMKRCAKVRKLQGKYGLALKLGLSIWIAALKSPVFRFSDLKALKNAFVINKNILEGFLGGFDLYAESPVYEVPVYYILGGNDWQAPYVIAQDYFERIEAPAKKLFVIPGAGHFTMSDQPELFFEALAHVQKEHPEIR